MPRIKLMECVIGYLFIACIAYVYTLGVGPGTRGMVKPRARMRAKLSTWRGTSSGAWHHGRGPPPSPHPRSPSESHPPNPHISHQLEQRTTHSTHHVLVYFSTYRRPLLQTLDASRCLLAVSLTSTRKCWQPAGYPICSALQWFMLFLCGWI